LRLLLRLLNGGSLAWAWVSWCGSEWLVSAERAAAGDAEGEMAERVDAEAVAEAAVAWPGRNWKWAVGVAVAMWVCGFFVARVPNATRPEFSSASSAFVVGFALPSYLALWRWAGARTSLQVLAALGAFALGIETLAVATGWPYGQFSYGDAIGGKVADLVPWTVPFAWTPLVLGTFVVVQRLSRLGPQRHRQILVIPPGRGQVLARVLAGALALAAVDLVLDPGAVRQKFWAFSPPGFYYGVPAQNYFGWILSGCVGHALLCALLRPRVGAPGQNGSVLELHVSATRGNTGSLAAADGVNRSALEGRAGGAAGEPPAGLAVSLAWTLAFWSSVCAWAGLWVPALLGHVWLCILWWAVRPRPERQRLPEPRT
jgi:putative membrane protein